MDTGTETQAAKPAAKARQAAITTYTHRMPSIRVDAATANAVEWIAKYEGWKQAQVHREALKLIARHYAAYRRQGGNRNGSA